MPKEESQYWPEDGGRITMHQTQHLKSDEFKHGASYFLIGRSGRDNGFKATGVAISSIFVDLPHTKSHSHAHPEAYLYAREGDGYSEIGGKQYDWNQGCAIHVPPGMLHHQHFNPYDREMKELRFELLVCQPAERLHHGRQALEGDHAYDRLNFRQFTLAG